MYFGIKYSPYLWGAEVYFSVADVFYILHSMCEARDPWGGEGGASTSKKETAPLILEKGKYLQPLTAPFPQHFQFAWSFLQYFTADKNKIKIVIPLVD